ncbi:SprT-like domain-containing protein [Desulfuromonas sp.]|uniref:SprT-like domain-containing protein n=1 Tax=Desulfuromonas sp. TaxID=892 RepID=UPI0025BD43C0|nr:SprT-like domain-containing protein [Desulfuromonas sp.]
MLPTGEAAVLLERLAGIPVRRSRATRTLGAYVSRGAEAVCIRLQFTQEPDILLNTFLHELAHACDHLADPAGRRHRRPHGPRWRAWATALGVDFSCRGRSEALAALHRKRLKVVAVCRRCGTEIRRTRRLPRGRSYLHPACGGQLLPV